MFKDLLMLLAILIFLVEIYRKLRQIWLRHQLSCRKMAKRPRKPVVRRPKSERDCRFCQEDKRKRKSAEREKPVAWALRKGMGGPKKKIVTDGYFCPNQACEYYRIADEDIHALVGYGTHGKQESIQDFKCQVCGKKFTARRNTILYRLNTHSGLIEKISWLLALGVDASALEEVFEVRELTIRTWLCRSGLQGRKLHELKGRLAAGCVPVFSTNGLKHYFYALIAHFGNWETADGKKSVWVLLSDFVYSQVIKHQRRRKTVEVERRVLVGEACLYADRLRQAGLSGRINTAFVERVNLTFRQCVSQLTRRTRGPAKYTPELMEHLEWFRSYYHLPGSGGSFF